MKDLPWESRELQRAQLDMGRLKETQKFAEKEKASADLELLKAKSAARELALEIEKSDAKAMAAKLELRDTDDQKYSKLMRELSSTKQELSSLKLDVAAALESKVRAECLIEASKAKAASCISSAEKMSKEIEELNEEHALVEIARIEAERETREIEARRKDEANRFSVQMEATKEQISALRREACEAKDLEAKLAATNSDLRVLQGEMELVRAMERNYREGKLMQEESETRSLLKAAEAELEEANKELASIKEEGFRYMMSMDAIRGELAFVANEAETLEMQERRADSSIQQLNARLLKAKSKLESVSLSEERTKAIVSNLSVALQQLRAQTEAEKKEKEMVAQETARTRQREESSERRMRSAEERLQAAVAELESAKASEAVAVKKLRDVAERTMKDRASSFAQSSTVTISKGEYEYLIKGAESAEVVADKKAEAARAWIEALKAEEEEILLTAKFVEKELRQIETERDEEVLRDAEEAEEEEEEEFKGLRLSVATPRKSTNRVSMGSARKSKMRRSSGSSGVKYSSRSPSFTVKRKRTVMPNLVRFLRRGSNRDQK